MRRRLLKILPCQKPIRAPQPQPVKSQAAIGPSHHHPAALLHHQHPTGFASFPPLPSKLPQILKLRKILFLSCGFVPSLQLTQKPPRTFKTRFGKGLWPYANRPRMLQRGLAFRPCCPELFVGGSYSSKLLKGSDPFSGRSPAEGNLADCRNGLSERTLCKLLKLSFSMPGQPLHSIVQEGRSRVFSNPTHLAKQSQAPTQPQTDASLREVT